VPDCCRVSLRWREQGSQEHAFEQALEKACHQPHPKSGASLSTIGSRYIEVSWEETHRSVSASERCEPCPGRRRRSQHAGTGSTEHGIASEALAARSSGYGPAAGGTQNFPRLAGRRARYLLE
jgi:hypothetical protein